MIRPTRCTHCGEIKWGTNKKYKKLYDYVVENKNVPLGIRYMDMQNYMNMASSNFCPLLDHMRKESILIKNIWGRYELG